MTLTQEILERDNFQCQYCLGKYGRAVQADHIIPKARQPEHMKRNDPAFMVAACRACNEAKATFCFVPRDRVWMVPGLKLVTHHTFRVYRGGPVSEMFR